MQIFDMLIIGGGPAGYFAALSAANKNPELKILILEKGKNVLSKVLISGGGRCNITHSCFEPKELIDYYPRGSKELLGPFYKFQPLDIIEWFKQRGVLTKTEKDGRVFPASNKSSTIVNCFVQEAEKAGIKININCKVVEVRFEKGIFILFLEDGTEIFSTNLLIAAGGNSKIAYEIASQFGHTILPPVPSLFTFNIKDNRLEGLQGVSVPHVEITLSAKSGSKNKILFSKGPMLITHWGISGPAVLKLSAFAARYLHEANYQSKLHINWLPALTQTNIIERLETIKSKNPKQLVSNHSVDEMIPIRLWKKIINTIGIDSGITWHEISKHSIQKLSKELSSGEFYIQGKGIFKDEFVTCGGIKLSEINFKTMESKLQPRLYFAGEVLNIDGLTGGFNFQSAWTTGWIAGQSIR